HNDPRMRQYLISRMDMLAQENTGALLVEEPRTMQPLFDRFTDSNRTPQDKIQLLRELRARGGNGLFDKLPDVDAAAADHGSRVLAIDTEIGPYGDVLDTYDGLRRRLSTSNPYMAAVITHTLEGLPPDRKNVVVLVGELHTNSNGGVDDLLSVISIDQFSSN